MTKKLLLTAAAAAIFAGCASAPETVRNELRAPAYPLVTVDPYTSAWSTADRLYDSQVKHWTGRDFPLMGTLRVDGEVYRFMGEESVPMKGMAPISYEKPWQGRYTFEAPREGWQNAGFDDSGWKTGEAAFGTPEETNIHTPWLTKDIWVRRTVEIDPAALKGGTLFVKYSHDDTFQLYFNGHEIVSTPYEWKKDRWVEIPAELAATAADGRVVLAAHCNNRTGGALVDMGLYRRDDNSVVMGRTAEQLSVDVQATSTVYEFACGGVDLTLRFTAPLLPDDLDLISRPVNYVTYEAKSNDGAEHDVEIYFEASPDWARDAATQECRSERYDDVRFNYVKSGTVGQKILGRKGDDVHIDWGYFYMAADKDATRSAVGDPVTMRREFADRGTVEGRSEGGQMVLCAQMGKVGGKAADGYIMIGYDDIYSIQYFGENVRPYWNRRGDSSIEAQFAKAAADYPSLMKRCRRFDAELMRDAEAAGGRKYAELCALAYRQAMAAHKLIETPQGELAWLSKENFSNGSIGTVDITYPSAPLFLYYNPELAKALLNFIFYYTESGKWTKPFPAHDVGTYPIANGQTYGGDMPVEESGNMLIVTGAVCKIEGKADYALKHWDALTAWADYLVENGLDPANQLCTDDFAGHWARNANLSIKATVAVAAYGDMARMAGKTDVAEKYTAKAREMAAAWKRMAAAGDHYRLSFDEGDTWSQKYNLVWDRLLGYNVFDADIAPAEIAYYLTKQNRYGLPLDVRRNYTKADWIVWTATMADDKATFERFIDPLYDFMNETVDRVPMSDWYNTDEPTHVGFQARSVVGGYFIKMLADREMR